MGAAAHPQPPRPIADDDASALYELRRAYLRDKLLSDHLTVAEMAELLQIESAPLRVEEW